MSSLCVLPPLFTLVTTAEHPFWNRKLFWVIKNPSQLKAKSAKVSRHLFATQPAINTRVQHFINDKINTLKKFIICQSNVFLKPQRAKEQKRNANIESTFMRYADVTFLLPVEPRSISHAHTHTNQQQIRRTFSSQLTSGCHADKPGGADHYLLRRRWQNTLMPQKPELMQEIRTRQSTRALTPIYPLSYFVISLLLAK